MADAPPPPPPPPKRPPKAKPAKPPMPPAPAKVPKKSPPPPPPKPKAAPPPSPPKRKRKPTPIRKGKRPAPGKRPAKRKRPAPKGRPQKPPGKQRGKGAPPKKRGRRIKIKLGLRAKKIGEEEDTYTDQIGWTVTDNVLDAYEEEEVKEPEIISHQCSMCGSTMQIPRPSRDRYKVICAYSECGHSDMMGA
ncbi:MAG: hypothetical protein HN534_01430 [Euryarchaeota archaeon]|jgi:hypothetical protein|nr:hypothetical protein [Euryarchaeota archaeon]MBT3653583.1 hypothetical protein [Euryarchaeota archaeon]MBT3757148.1 hypothetical protein [Euryarchaeota archaeon]MBT4051075.1 hypothetical protein [Euryarchaeota archaeon]MBT4347113.1 hypothetical protein [Euryarchaeota archaeon]